MSINCKVCGVEIPAGRLKILPHTKTCVNHSTEGAWKVNVITVGDIDKDDHYQDVEIIKDPKAYEELQNYRKQLGNYSKQ